MKTIQTTIAVIILMLNFTAKAQNTDSLTTSVSLSIKTNLITESTTLHWHTRNQQDVKYYIIEKSENGISFKPIITKKAMNENNLENDQVQRITQSNSTVYFRVILVLNNGERISSLPIVYYQFLNLETGKMACLYSW